MTPEQVKDRLFLLRAEWVQEDLIKELYGIDLNNEPKLLKALDFWSNKIGRKLRGAGAFNRREIEYFLYEWGVKSMKMAALSIGMTEDSLRRTLAAMDPSYVENWIASPVSENMVRGKNFLKNIRQYFRYYCASNTEDDIEELHEDIRTRLGVDVEPVYCPVSMILGEKKFGTVLDAITLEPIFSHHTVWMYTGKPLYISPDVCSLATYLRYESVLKGQVNERSIPEEIDPKLKSCTHAYHP